MMRRVPGITIVEVVVAIAITTIVVVGLIPLLLHILTSNIRASSENALQFNAQNTTASIANDVGRAQRFLVAPDHTDTTPPAPAGGWQGSNAVLILRQPATTLAPQDPNRAPVYTGASNTSDCSAEKHPVFVNLVFYVHDSTLYKRTITPSLAGTCGNVAIFQVSSCLTCSDKPKDVPLAKNVENFNLIYQPEDALSPDPYVSTKRARIELTIKNDSGSYTYRSMTRLLLANDSIGNN